MAVRRASPLSPEARRASIIAATLPLLRAHGRAVTTAQIALAAGVAEGTLFRVFPDKEALIAAAVESAFDPAPIEGELARIDRELPLRDKLVTAVEILQRRVEGVWQLMAVLGIAAPPDPKARAAAGKLMTEADGRMRAQLAALLEAHRDELRIPPEHAARLLRAMTFAGTHPRITDVPLTAGEIVTILLDGIRARDDEELS
jgi:AcrR family transcriptional regulator